MAASLSATADPTLRHLMTPNLRTMLLCRIHIDMRPVHDRSRGNLPPIPSPTSVSPNEPEKNRRQVAQLGDRDPPNLTTKPIQTPPSALNSAFLTPRRDERP
jgi:hypothetical protein